MYKYSQLSALKSYSLVGGFVAVLGLTFYPIFIHPMLNIEEYKKVQEINRKDIDVESVQPGGMKVWSDPFGRK